jgi:hypothetical protein
MRFVDSFTQGTEMAIFGFQAIRHVVTVYLLFGVLSLRVYYEPSRALGSHNHVMVLGGISNKPNQTIRVRERA